MPNKYKLFQCYYKDLDIDLTNINNFNVIKISQLIKKKNCNVMFLEMFP